jgi:cold shock CspA family protein
MRYEGKLKKWNAERGFGFICANDSGQDIFVHVSAFPRDGQQPLEGELLSLRLNRTAKAKSMLCESGALGPHSQPKHIHPEPMSPVQGI